MKKSQIAVQLYTLRDYLKTPADIAATLKRVREMGYEAVQISGMGPIAEEELVKILDGEGLVCCATHEPGVDIIEKTDAVIERLKKLNCQYTAYPGPHRELDTEEDIITLAKDMDAAAQKMAAEGIVLTFHNHAREFEVFNGRTMLDIFYDEAPNLQAEIDTFWVQHGGANPTTWVNKLKGRLPLLHLKDFGVIKNKITMFHIGGGNLEWDSILPAAEAGGTKWFIIEQDTCPIDPFDSLKLSLDYLTENFVK